MFYRNNKTIVLLANSNVILNSEVGPKLTDDEERFTARVALLQAAGNQAVYNWPAAGQL